MTERIGRTLIKATPDHGGCHSRDPGQMIGSDAASHWIHGVSLRQRRDHLTAFVVARKKVCCHEASPPRIWATDVEPLRDRINTPMPSCHAGSISVTRMPIRLRASEPISREFPAAKRYRCTGTAFVGVTGESGSTGMGSLSPNPLGNILQREPDAR